MNDVETVIESIPTGVRIVSLFTATEVPLRAKSKVTGERCEIGSVVRHCWRNGMIGANYSNAVNNQREREGIEDEFNPLLLWNGKGRYVEGSKRIVEHTEKGTKYLAFYPKSVDNCPIVADDKYYADGIEVSKDEIEEFLKDSGTSERQGTEKKIFWRTIGLDSIRAIKFSGETIVFA